MYKRQKIGSRIKKYCKNKKGIVFFETQCSIGNFSNYNTKLAFAKSCNKPETVLKATQCSAVLAACNSLNVSPRVDTIKSNEIKSVDLLRRLSTKALGRQT